MRDFPREIQEVAVLIKNMDPRLYERLISTLDAYTYGLTVAVTEAPNDEILACKGRAQQARIFLNLLTSREPNKPSP